MHVLKQIKTMVNKMFYHYGFVLRLRKEKVSEIDTAEDLKHHVFMLW